MATLADINKTLQEQNSFLESVQKNTEDNKESVESLVERLTGLSQKEKELEAKRKSKPTSSGGGFSLPSLAGGLGFGLGGLAAGGLIGSLMSGLMKIGKGGILAIAGTYLADAVGDYIENGGGDKELADAARRAIQVGSIASLFGLRFGLIGAAVAAVLDEESIAKIKEIGTEVVGKLPYLGTLFEDLGIYVPSLTDVTQTVNNGLDGTLAFLKGDMSTFLTNFGDFQSTVGGLLLLFPSTRLIGVSLIALGTAFDAIADELGVHTAALLEGLALFGGAAFMFRKKIAAFLRRNGPENLDDNLKPKDNKTPLTDNKGKPLKTSAELMEERFNKQEKGFFNRMGNLFKGLKIPAIPRFGPALAVTAVGAGVYDAATETDPNLYGLGDLYRDLSTPLIGLHNYLMGEQGKVESVNENLIRSLQGAKDQSQGFRFYEEPQGRSGSVLNQYGNEFYGPAGATSSPQGFGVLAPQVDASTTSVDQSQSALIKMDPHIGAENPFAIYDR